MTLTREEFERTPINTRKPMGMDIINHFVKNKNTAYTVKEIHDEIKKTYPRARYHNIYHHLQRLVEKKFIQHKPPHYIFNNGNQK